MHRTGLVVVERQIDYRRQRTKKGSAQWTLHRADCTYLQRENAPTGLPAPIKAYPGTVACKTCKPPTLEGPADGNR